MKPSQICRELIKDYDVPEFSHTGSLLKVMDYDEVLEYSVLVARFGNLKQDEFGNLVEEPLWNNYVWQILECEWYFDKHAASRRFRSFLTE